MTEASAPAPQGRPQSRLRTMWLMLAAVAAPVVILDQAGKLYIAAHLRLYESVAIVPHLLDLTYTRNPGAAFSMFTDLPARLRAAFLFTITVVALIVLIVLMARAEKPSWQTIGFALITGGALGNLIDRTRQGVVIDFIHVHYYGWNYPVFNVADSAITIGVAILLIEALSSNPGSSGG